MNKNKKDKTPGDLHCAWIITTAVLFFFMALGLTIYGLNKHPVITGLSWVVIVSALSLYVGVRLINRASYARKTNTSISKYIDWA